MNWGWKLAIGSSLFMAMIIYFVVTSFTTSTKTHLVSKNYYEEELKFQEQIDAKQNAEELKDTLFVSMLGSDVLIQYPDFFSNTSCKGTIHFYKPANGNHDKRIQFSQNEGEQIIPRKYLEPGRYQVKFNLTVDNRNYYYEKPLTII